MKNKIKFSLIVTITLMSLPFLMSAQNITVGSAGTVNTIPKYGPSNATQLAPSQITDNSNGNVGINVATPSKKLSINGDLQLESYTHSFYLNGSRILGAGGASDIENVYVGLNAGPGGPNNSGSNNICVGIGSGSTLYNSESDNVLVGGYAGINLQGGNADGNICIGTYSGGDMINAGSNVSIGYFTGFGVVDGANNVAVGGAAYYTADVSNSTLVGYSASTSDNNSCAIGYNSIADGNNSVALGANAYANGDDLVVLGDDDVHVLMGYNSIPPSLGNAYRLYVDAWPSDRVAYFNGAIYTTNVFGPSDRKLKSNIQSLDAKNIDDIIDRLAPKSYTYKTKDYPQLNLPESNQFGLIADELEVVLPDLVSEQIAPAKQSKDGSIITPETQFKSINYTGLIPILLQEIKNQKAKIEDQEVRLARLEALISGSSPEGNSNTDVKLGSNIILNQNDPNPFTEATTITYSIPNSVQDAKVIFYDNANSIIQTVSITERGNGQLSVNVGNLTSGLYTYSLVADGKVIATKKMICNR